MLLPSRGLAQGTAVTLHVDPRWEEFAFHLNAALTQEGWHQLAAEAGIVTYFRPLADARPLGARNFEVSLLRWEIGIDDTDPAWNDTFVHPDPEHWLFDGSRPATPRHDGPSRRHRPGGGGGVRHEQLPLELWTLRCAGSVRLPHDPESPWAASSRASFMSPFGSDDLDFTVFGLDLVGSREFALTSWASVSPYAGVTGYLSRAREKTNAVALDDETVPGAQAMLGVVARVSAARVAVDLSTARVNARSLRVGVSF